MKPAGRTKESFAGILMAGLMAVAAGAAEEAEVEVPVSPAVLDANGDDFN